MSGLLLPRVVIPVAALALAVLAMLAVLDRLGDNERAATRRALLMRAAELERSVLAPGSVLPCVDGAAGETVANSCEKKVFANAQSAAAAVAYMAARIDLLSQAHALARRGDAGALAALVSTRRAVSLDRYGIAAHVLSRRDGCTASKCAVFAMVADAGALKANLKAQTFDQYVSRYAASWDAPAAAAGPAVSALPANPSPDEAHAEASPPDASVVRKPVSSKWHFPSADSIPAVSIMTPEPKLPKDVATRLNRETVRSAEIERRKEGKEVNSGAATKDASSGEVDKKQAGTRQQDPGAPLQLTR